jgi:hypothetical protein
VPTSATPHTGQQRRAAHNYKNGHFRALPLQFSAESIAISNMGSIKQRARARSTRRGQKLWPARSLLGCARTEVWQVLAHAPNNRQRPYVHVNDTKGKSEKKNEEITVSKQTQVGRDEKKREK